MNKRTKLFGRAGVSEYCAPCLRRLNRGLKRNGISPLPASLCLAGHYFACSGCGDFFEGSVPA